MTLLNFGVKTLKKAKSDQAACLTNCPPEDNACYQKCNRYYRKDLIGSLTFKSNEKISKTKGSTQLDNCPCRPGCPSGCPCFDYKCPEPSKLESVLILHGTEAAAEVTNIDGEVFDITWENQGDVNVYGLCSLTWQNEQLIFGLF